VKAKTYKKIAEWNLGIWGIVQLFSWYVAVCGLMDENKRDSQLIERLIVIDSGEDIFWKLSFFIMFITWCSMWFMRNHFQKISDGEDHEEDQRNLN
jgi:hypothetical protein